MVVSMSPPSTFFDDDHFGRQANFQVSSLTCDQHFVADPGFLSTLLVGAW